MFLHQLRIRPAVVGIFFLAISGLFSTLSRDILILIGYFNVALADFLKINIFWLSLPIINNFC